MRHTNKQISFDGESGVLSEELKMLNKKENEQIGLAFSGGGIRSATVCLGVLQSLAKNKLLTEIDYLSTVSGGGYIGAWFSSLIYRHPLKLDGAQEDLGKSTKPTGGSHVDNITDRAMNWLRSDSNYLTPKTGLFSLDSLAAFAHWIANTMINQALFTAFLVLSMMLIINLSFSSIVESIPGGATSFNLPSVSYTLIAGAIFVVASIVSAFIHKNNRFNPLNRIAPLKLTNNIPSEYWIYLLGTIGIYLILAAFPTGTSPVNMPSNPASHVTSITPNYNIGLGVPLAALLLSACIVLINPILKNSAYESEWWYRLGALNTKVSIFWLSAFTFALYLPNYLITHNIANPERIDISGAFAWLISFAVAKFGQSKTSSQTSSASIRLLSKYLPYLIILLIFIGAGFISYALVQSANKLRWMIFLLLFIAYGNFFFSINLFSLHNFYRNRLTKCYLGATNLIERQKSLDNFSGFAEQDDMWLAELANQKPVHIINTALNITDGSELAWQQRQAASFFFTPFYSGYQLPDNRCGFVDTKKYIYPAITHENPNQNGPKMGSLIAISGAAASPNMGYHTSPVMAFIMTLFNARLGRWCGNPANPEAAARRGPVHNLYYLLKELILGTSLKDDYFYLSDGGHFENLGIYELVRRKCKLIIAIDAGEDGKYQFEDLGNAIRKCKVDFGVDIDISLNDIYPTGKSQCGNFSVSKKPFAIGKINYANDKKGILIYVKSSLTKDIPTDLINFKLQEPAFPHQSTVDQFFDESQFESYRHLGELIAESMVIEMKVNL